MKKSVIMLSLAAVLAVGSAIASSFAPQTVYVRVKKQGQSNFTCANTGQTCDPSGTAACKVTVTIDLPPSTKQVDGRILASDGTCLEVLKNTTATNFSYNPSDIIIDAE